jgi:hypothetical protein
MEKERPTFTFSEVIKIRDKHTHAGILAGLGFGIGVGFFIGWYVGSIAGRSLWDVFFTAV